jgi:hypothetical protein
MDPGYPSPGRQPILSAVMFDNHFRNVQSKAVTAAALSPLITNDKRLYNDGQ